jgi:hypothetical protein
MNNANPTQQWDLDYLCDSGVIRLRTPTCCWMRDKYMIHCDVHNSPPNFMNQIYAPSISSLRYIVIIQCPTNVSHVRWLFTGSSKVKNVAPTQIANSTVSGIPPVSAQHPSQCWDIRFNHDTRTHLQFGSQSAISHPGKTVVWSVLSSTRSTSIMSD